jgi:hypothetical protein
VSPEFINQKTREVMKAAMDELRCTPFKLSDKSDYEYENDDELSDDPFGEEKCMYGKACSYITAKRLEEMKESDMQMMRDYFEDLGKYDPMRCDFDRKFQPSGELHA